jgi:hypothetical protein
LLLLRLLLRLGSGSASVLVESLTVAILWPIRTAVDSATVGFNGR